MRTIAWVDDAGRNGGYRAQTFYHIVTVCEVGSRTHTNPPGGRYCDPQGDNALLLAEADGWVVYLFPPARPFFRIVDNM